LPQKTLHKETKQPAGRCFKRKNPLKNREIANSKARKAAGRKAVSARQPGRENKEKRDCGLQESG